MTDDLYALGREVLGLEQPSQGVRHFLPVVDHEAMRNPPRIGEEWSNAWGCAWGWGWLFEGYGHANLSRYIGWHSTGDCLTPDIHHTTIDWFDPQLPVRPGDIGLLTIRLPGADPCYMAKSIQERDGCLWACSNDGDFPLSEHMELGGRLVMLFVPRKAGV